jgi:hypothetical protein
LPHRLACTRRMMFLTTAPNGSGTAADIMYSGPVMSSCSLMSHRWRKPKCHDRTAGRYDCDLCLKLCRQNTIIRLTKWRCAASQGRGMTVLSRAAYDAHQMAWCCTQMMCTKSGEGPYLRRSGHLVRGCRCERQDQEDPFGLRPGVEQGPERVAQVDVEAGTLGVPCDVAEGVILDAPHHPRPCLPQLQNTRPESGEEHVPEKPGCIATPSPTDKEECVVAALIVVRGWRGT